MLARSICAEHTVLADGSHVEHVISTKRNVVGDLVGSYNDLAELMALMAKGKVTLHTRTYPLDAVKR